jgi:hypothetical protein
MFVHAGTGILPPRLTQSIFFVAIFGSATSAAIGAASPVSRS